MPLNSWLDLEQGREVFAVPGMARSLRSKGTHTLIRQGAKLVEDAEDVLEEIRPLIRPAQSAQSLAFIGKPNSPEARILLRILDKVPKHIDQIAQEANLPAHRTAATLLELELRGLVSQLPGKYFISGYN